MEPREMGLMSPEIADKKTPAEENFAQWNTALQTGNPDKVAALYAADATFLPTVSGEFKKGPEQAKEYFVHFLEKNPIGEIIEAEVQELSADCYLHSGMYNFEVDAEGARKTIRARFSYVWQLDDQGSWKIIHHHSSVVPE